MLQIFSVGQAWILFLNAILNSDKVLLWKPWWFSYSGCKMVMASKIRDPRPQTWGLSKWVFCSQITLHVYQRDLKIVEPRPAKSGQSSVLQVNLKLKRRCDIDKDEDKDKGRPGSDLRKEDNQVSSRWASSWRVDLILQYETWVQCWVMECVLHQVIWFDLLHQVKAKLYPPPKEEDFLWRVEVESDSSCLSYIATVHNQQLIMNLLRN